MRRHINKHNFVMVYEYLDVLIFSNSLTKISPLKFKFRKKGKLIDIISFEIKRLFQNILIGARTSLDPKMQKKCSL